MPPASRRDPLGSFNFVVEIDGIATAAFAECSGLGSETHVIEYRTGDSFTTAKLPGLTKFSNITLKRGITRDDALWKWRRAVADGKADRRNGAIVLLDEARSPVLRATFRNGWPCRWEGPALNARGSDVAIEAIEIAHEGLELETL